MARKLRVEYPGAIYHGLNHGDRREPIFQDEADRQRFVETLGGETFRQELLAQMNARLGAEHYGEERAETTLTMGWIPERQGWTHAGI